jgi:hypothetical protein
MQFTGWLSYLTAYLTACGAKCWSLGLLHMQALVIPSCFVSVRRNMEGLSEMGSKENQHEVHNKIYLRKLTFKEFHREFLRTAWESEDHIK